MFKYTHQGFVDTESEPTKYEFKSYMTEETEPPSNVIEIGNKLHLQ